MKTFKDLCLSIDWKKMEKARITVKNLAKEKKSLIYLSEFLDELAESATDVYGIPSDLVHYKSMLQVRANQQKN